uniref:Uncharacterized protein n=1 Tax=Peronospora matthiolae TaxID=2874970 RepID=A0AAV1TRQ1_9STRA
MMARVEELEVQRLTLPDPTALTFGLEERPVRGEHLRMIEATPQEVKAVSARHLDVDDLGDLSGTGSRVHDASLRTQRQALRQEQQKHCTEYACARMALHAASDAHNPTAG